MSSALRPEEMTPVPSPCIGICEMGGDGLCKGCLRTIEEICEWRAADDAFKRAVWREIRRREQQLGL